MRKCPAVKRVIELSFIRILVEKFYHVCFSYPLKALKSNVGIRKNVKNEKVRGILKIRYLYKEKIALRSCFFFSVN